MTSRYETAYAKRNRKKRAKPAAERVRVLFDRPLNAALDFEMCRANFLFAGEANGLQVWTYRADMDIADANMQTVYGVAREAKSGFSVEFSGA